jgi:nitroreductase
MEETKMKYSQPVAALIERRFSCRTYRDEPLKDGRRHELEAYLAALQRGPFGTPLRFQLVAASKEDGRTLRGLGTYGFIKNAPGFILGAVPAEGRMSLEDFGYAMEDAILFATALGLGTCWLGGTFRKSTFAARLALGDEEVMPCVTSVGRPAGRRSFVDRLIRQKADSKSRLPWQSLFFDRRFDVPLRPAEAGPFAGPLEMVRLAPSASNKQPWRVVREGPAWHFYLERTPGYLQGLGSYFVTADLQRVDMGIALCHFALTAQEAGLGGHWVVDEPDLPRPGDRIEYSATWLASGASLS